MQVAFVILENVVSNGVSFGSITPTLSSLDQLRVLHHFISTEFDGFNNSVFTLWFTVFTQIYDMYGSLQCSCYMPNIYCLQGQIQVFNLGSDLNARSNA